MAPLGMAIADGLANNPEPPIYDDARLARRLMNDEIGPDGPTSGWGKLGQRAAENITGTNARYTLIQGDSATAKWHFIGGNQNPSYNVYINQIENLKQKHKLKYGTRTICCTINLYLDRCDLIFHSQVI
jgi:hypothetical protein